MATFLDISALGYFSLIFPFLLSFCIVYGLLTYTKVFGKESIGVNAVISFAIGILALFSRTVTETLNRSAPWFVVFFLFIVFTIMAFKFFGVSDENLVGLFRGTEYRFIAYWIIGISIIIVLGTMVSVMSEEGGVGYSGSARSADGSAVAADAGGATPEAPQKTEFWRAFTHPKSLGLILLLLIAAFTIQRLAVYQK